MKLATDITVKTYRLDLYGWLNPIVSKVRKMAKRSKRNSRGKYGLTLTKRTRKRSH